MKRKLWFRLLRPSTQSLIDEARRTPGFSLFDRLHGYAYMRWPYLYIGIAVGEHPIARRFGFLLNKLISLFWPDLKASRPERAASSPARPDVRPVTFADTYHGKAMPLEAAKQLIAVRQDIRLTNLETVIPYARARDIVLRSPDHIVALECPCRAARPQPCRPLDVCLIVGEPFASFMIEHHPGRTRWLTQQEATDILQAEHDRGHVHHAFFKDAMLGRYYAICNCCSCCCGAMQAHRNGIPMLASSGYVNHVDLTRCIGCGQCAQVCPFGAMEVENQKATVDLGRCMGCGVCVDRCEQKALVLQRATNKGDPLDIAELLATVAQPERVSL